MDPWGMMVATKVARFVAGLTITVGCGWWGTRHGRRLRAQGFTGESFNESTRLTPRILIKDLAIAGLILFLAYEAEDRLLLLTAVGGYLTQFGLVTLRSLLVFVMAMQWQLWDDRTRLRRAMWVIVPAILIMSVMEAFSLWPASTTLGGAEYDLRSGIVLQSTGVSCAPAALATVCRMYGKPVTEEDACIDMGTGMAGTTDNDIVAGARAQGFPEARSWRPTLEEIASADLPLLVSIKFFDVWDLHAVALVGLTTDTVLIADPLIGLRSFRRETFHQEWRGHATYLGHPSFPSSGTVSLADFRPERLKALLPARKPKPGPASGTPGALGSATATP